MPNAAPKAAPEEAPQDIGLHQWVSETALEHHAGNRETHAHSHGQKGPGKADIPDDGVVQGGDGRRIRPVDQMGQNGFDHHGKRHMAGARSGCSTDLSCPMQGISIPGSGQEFSHFFYVYATHEIRFKQKTATKRLQKKCFLQSLRGR